MKNKQKTSVFSGFNWLKVQHTKERVKERYGLVLTDNDILDIVKKIQGQQSIRAWRSSDARRMHVVEVKGKEILFVYDKNRKIPITALPYDSGTK